MRNEEYWQSHNVLWYLILFLVVPIVLVGNKMELQTDEHTIKRCAKFKQAPLKAEDGPALARKINAFAYIECSAKLNEGVGDVFQALTQASLLTEKKKKV